MSTSRDNLIQKLEGTSSDALVLKFLDIPALSNLELSSEKNFSLVNKEPKWESFDKIIIKIEKGGKEISYEFENIKFNQILWQQLIEKKCLHVTPRTPGKPPTIYLELKPLIQNPILDFKVLQDEGFLKILQKVSPEHLKLSRNNSGMIIGVGLGILSVIVLIPASLLLQILMIAFKSIQIVSAFTSTGATDDPSDLFKSTASCVAIFVGSAIFAPFTGLYSIYQAGRYGFHRARKYGVLSDISDIFAATLLSLTLTPYDKYSWKSIISSAMGPSIADAAAHWERENKNLAATYIKELHKEQNKKPASSTTPSPFNKPNLTPQSNTMWQQPLDVKKEPSPSAGEEDNLNQTSTIKGPSS